VLYPDEHGRGPVTHAFWPNVGGGQGLDDRLATFEARFPSDASGRRWLMPALGGEQTPLAPLLTWWILLLGLSSLARYEPASWVKALDVDASQVAVPLEAALEAAQHEIPKLVLDALA
jgi:hypothetical protein